MTKNEGRPGQDSPNNQHIDFTVAETFLQALDPEDSFVFQTFGDARKDPGLVRTLPGTFAQHRGELARLNQDGAGIFVTVARTDGQGRKRENITGVRAVFADFDGAPIPDEWPLLEPHLIIESSPGKWHAYWFVEPCFPLDLFEPTQKAIAARFGSDPAVIDLPRVLRVPGFIHRKKEPFRTHIVRDWSQEPRYTPSQIIEAFHPTPTEKAPPPPTDDPVLKKLTEKGMVIRQDREKGKFIIKCPWADQHTTGNGEAAFWLPNHGGFKGAGYRCMHAHCVNRTVKDLLEWLGVRKEKEPKVPEIITRRLSEVQSRPYEWPDPEPLPELRPPVEPFRDELLPTAFRPWIRDIAERMQCPADFPAIGAIVSLAAMVGRKIGIRPKRRDDWTVIPNLWGGIVGRPGILKTPSLDQVLLPLRRLHAEAIEANAQALNDWTMGELIRKTKRELLSGELRKTLKAGSDTSEIENELAKLKEDCLPPRIKDI